MHLEYARKTAKDLAIRAAQQRNQFSRTNRPIMCVESTRIDLYIYMYIYVTNHIDGNVVWFSSFDAVCSSKRNVHFTTASSIIFAKPLPSIAQLCVDIIKTPGENQVRNNIWEHNVEMMSNLRCAFACSMRDQLLNIYVTSTSYMVIIYSKFLEIGFEYSAHVLQYMRWVMNTKYI